MEKGYADGISRIEINSLWGRKHIVWNLRPDVNILSGVNGTGKSTILNKTVARLDYLAGESQEENPEVQIDYFPEITIPPQASQGSTLPPSQTCSLDTAITFLNTCSKLPLIMVSVTGGAGDIGPQDKVHGLYG